MEIRFAIDLTRVSSILEFLLRHLWDQVSYLLIRLKAVVGLQKSALIKKCMRRNEIELNHMSIADGSLFSDKKICQKLSKFIDMKNR
jgi:hypothetical protein